jgi:hypothetical protein
VKKFAALLLLVFGLFAGGCALGLPISPLLFLLKNDPPPMREATPNAPTPPADTPTPAVTTPDNANATV